MNHITGVPNMVARSQHAKHKEPTLLEQDHCTARPTFPCAANHPVEAWVERPKRNGGGWYCSGCFVVVR